MKPFQKSLVRFINTFKFATESSCWLMTKNEKLIARFLTMPSDFHFDELVKMLTSFGFSEMKKGKTSGSRVKFMDRKGTIIILHKPHPTGIMKHYQLKQIKEVLGL